MVNAWSFLATGKKKEAADLIQNIAFKEDDSKKQQFLDSLTKDGEKIDWILFFKLFLGNNHDKTQLQYDKTAMMAENIIFNSLKSEIPNMDNDQLEETKYNIINLIYKTYQSSDDREKDVHTLAQVMDPDVDESKLALVRAVDIITTTTRRNSGKKDIIIWIITGFLVVSVLYGVFKIITFDNNELRRGMYPLLTRLGRAPADVGKPVKELFTGQ